MDNPELQRDRINASTLATPNQHKRRVVGWSEATDPTFTVLLTRAQLNTFMDYYWSRAVLYWQSIFADAVDGTDLGYVAFRAAIGNIKPGTNLQRESTELIMVNVTLVIHSIDATAGFYVGTSPA